MLGGSGGRHGIYYRHWRHQGLSLCLSPTAPGTIVIVITVRSWWRHQMETFSAYLAFCAGNSPAPVNSSHKGRWRGALMFSFIYAWINDWVNNREAGDLRCHRGHCDVDVMILQASFTRNTSNAVYGLLQTNLHSSAVLWENIQGSYLLFWQ